MGACAPSRDVIEASKPIQLCLVGEDGSREPLKSWAKETVTQLLEREFGLYKQLRSSLKFIFSDQEVPHTYQLEEAGIESEAVVKIIGLRVAIESKQREEAERARKRREQQERDRLFAERKEREREAEVAASSTTHKSSSRNSSYKSSSSSRESVGASCGRGAGARGRGGGSSWGSYKSLRRG